MIRPAWTGEAEINCLLSPGCDSPFPPALPAMPGGLLSTLLQSLRTHLFHEAFPEDKKDSPALTRDYRFAHLCFERRSWIQPLFLALGSCS